MASEIDDWTESEALEIAQARIRDLLAEVERLKADAKLGKAVRRMPSLGGLGREFATLVYSVVDNRWFVVTRPGRTWDQMADVSDESHRTPDAALAAAGLMGEEPLP